MSTNLRHRLEETLALVELRIWNARSRCHVDRDTAPCRKELRELLGTKEEILEQLSDLAASETNGADRPSTALLRSDTQLLIQRVATRWPSR